jgi:hypothetical protein
MGSMTAWRSKHVRQKDKVKDKYRPKLEELKRKHKQAEAELEIAQHQTSIAQKQCDATEISNETNWEQFKTRRRSHVCWPVSPSQTPIPTNWPRR